MIIALSASTLLEEGHAGPAREARALRRLLEDLWSMSSRSFPVHVVVTRCDRISGFTEFLDALPTDVGGACLGWAPPAGSSGYDPEAFADGMDRLVEELFRIRPRCLANRSSADPRAIYFLPAELERVIGPLELVCDVLLSPEPTGIPPVHGGVYFVGRPGEGPVLAPALSELNRALGLPSSEPTPVPSPGAFPARSHRILLAEAILPFRAAGTGLRTTPTRALLCAVIAALAMAGGAGLTHSYLGRAAVLDEMERSLPPEESAVQLADGLAVAAELCSPSDRFGKVGDLESFLRERAGVVIAAIIQPVQEEGVALLEAGIPDRAGGYRDTSAYLDRAEEYQLLVGAFPGEDGDPARRPIAHRLAERLRARGRLDSSEFEQMVDLLIDPQAAPALPGLVAGRSRIEGVLIRKLDPTLRRLRASMGEDVELSDPMRAALHGSAYCLVEACRSPGEPGGEPPDSWNAWRAFLDRLRHSQAMLDRSFVVAPPDPPDEASDPRRISRILGRIPEPVKAEVLERLGTAAAAIVRRIQTAYSREVVAKSYDRPSEGSLARIRSEITATLKELDLRSFAELGPHFETIEGAPVEVRDEQGELVRRNGWWDVPMNLLVGLEANPLKAAYLQQGLEPLLAGHRLGRERAADRYEEVFTVRRLSEQVLPFLSRQVEFFRDPRLAAETREQAMGLLHQALAGFLGEMEQYWLGRFSNAFPAAPAKTLPELYEQIRLLNDPRWSFRQVMEEIRDALSGIASLQPEKDDVLLAESEELRRRIFNTFSPGLDPTDQRAGRYTTIEEAVEDVRGLEKALEPIVRGFGDPDGELARNLLGRVVAGSHEFRRTSEVIEALKKQGDASKPAQAFADWLGALYENTLGALAELTAGDLNAAWLERQKLWSRALTDGRPATLLRILGPTDSELEGFLRDYLDPFFKRPEFQPKAGNGPQLLLSPEFRAWLAMREEVLGRLSPDGTGFVADRAILDLFVAGERATSLTASYTTLDMDLVSDELRTDGKPVEFGFAWSPDECVRFEFRVGFDHDQTRKLTWTGPFAVAMALLEARREGDQFVWKREDPELGAFTISARLVGDRGWLELFDRFGKQEPSQVLSSRFPSRIVELRK